MTMQTTTGYQGRSFFASLRAAGHWVADVFGATAEAVRCAREVERLSAMSDAELARRGIKRQEIVNHAFRTLVEA